MIRLLAAAAVVALAATPALACSGMKDSASAMAPMTPAPAVAEAGKGKSAVTTERKVVAGQTAASGSKTRPAQ